MLDVDYNKEIIEKVPGYLKSETEYESFGILKVEEKYLEDLELMFENMIENSEVKTIMFSSQYEKKWEKFSAWNNKIRCFFEKIIFKRDSTI